MKFEVINKHGSVGHIYQEKDLSAAICYAKERHLKIIDRKTKKILYNFCKEKNNVKL